MKIIKKHIVIISSVLILVILGFTYLKPVKLNLDYSPVVLYEVFSDDSLTGVWKGVSYEQSDCTGCETKNKYFLSIASDSTAIVSAKTDQFNVLFREPFKNLAFGYTKRLGWTSSTKYHVRGNCLVLFKSDAENGSTFPPPALPFQNLNEAVSHFNNNYKDYGCNLRPNEFPVLTFKLEFLPDRVVLIPSVVFAP